MKRVACGICNTKVPYKHRSEHEKTHGAIPRKRGRPLAAKEMPAAAAFAAAELELEVVEENFTKAS